MNMQKEKTYDLLCIGMALVDSIIRGFDPEPVSASGFRAESGTLNVGGEAVNEAMAAAKLGLRTGILCALADDAAGDMVRSAMERCGVDTRPLDKVAEAEAAEAVAAAGGSISGGVSAPAGGSLPAPGSHSTPVTTMFVNADGSRKSITNSAHRYNFHPEKYPEIIRQSRAVTLGSLFRAPFDDPEVIRGVVSAAKESGAIVLADTKLPNFRRLTMEDIKDILPLIDYIFPNEDEARYYTSPEGRGIECGGELTPEEMAGVFLDYGVKNVIIKLGAKGCLFMSERETIRLDALDIRAVDATGAGDNFLAGFAAAKLGDPSFGAPEQNGCRTGPGSGGISDEYALRFGNACGAICTTAVGAATALRNREQVEEMLQG